MTDSDRLLSIYLETLSACEPADLLLRRAASMPILFSGSRVHVVSLGKAAASRFRGACEIFDVHSALVIVPESYPGMVPGKGVRVVSGGHPAMNGASFRAGEELARFVASAGHPLVVMISGGSSACAELPLAPWFDQREVSFLNSALVTSGLPIARMNTVRKHVSAVKGGRLAAATRQPLLTLVYSDVGTGDLGSVGSGPTLPDPTRNSDAAEILRQLTSGGNGIIREMAVRLASGDLPETASLLPHVSSELIADNSTLVDAAARTAQRSFERCTMVEAQMERDVETEAANLAARLATLDPGTLLVAGGEPTVRVSGPGRGGRCSELALRLLRRLRGDGCDFVGLFAGSDGMDGNTAAAGVVISSGRAGEVSNDEIAEAIERSDTFPLACRIGAPVVQKSTGNNLRDLALIVRN